MSLSQDQHYLEKTLRLAQKGRLYAHPNPRVGCLIVKNNKIVGEGFHSYFGGDHAEVVAIKKAGQKTQNASLYVNLEPCSHWGKTPPCVDLIIKSKIKKVVIGVKDPHPKVKGRGIQKLRRAGIKTHVGILSQECSHVNRAFLKAHEQKRSYVLLKIAQTLDGKIASKTGKSKWITGQKARTFGHQLRAQSDAVMVGANTIRKDNPALISHGMGPDPIRLVVSSSGQLPVSSKIFNEKGQTWILTGDKEIISSEKTILKRGNKILRYPLKNRQLNLKNIMERLYQLGVIQILLEGGSALSSSMLDQKLVNEVYSFIAPSFLGGRNAKSSIVGKGWKSPQLSPRLKNIDLAVFDEDVLIHGYL